MKTQSPKKVLFLSGGVSSERPVSLISTPRIIEAIRASGYTLDVVDVQEPISEALTHIVQSQADVVFNGLYGGIGENGTIQGLLNALRIPYTHSGVLASALAMDKSITRALLIPQGVTMPRGYVLLKADLLRAPPFPRPFVVKPIAQGSSVGVTIVWDQTDLKEACAQCAFGDYVLVEEWIPGVELSVGLLGPRALGVIEIAPVEGFYDYKAKYMDQATKHTMPAAIPDEVYQQALMMAERVYDLLGCRGIARVDMRYDAQRAEGHQLYCLEMNTQPGLTPVSLLPEIAAYHGITFEKLIVWMIENAQCDL